VKFLLTALLMLPFFASASCWEKVGVSNGTTMYIDACSIAIESIYKKAWVKIEFDTPRNGEKDIRLPEKIYDSSKILFYFNCRSEKYLPLKMVFYNQLDVVASFSNKLKSSEFSDTIPDSLNERMTAMACNFNMFKKANTLQKWSLKYPHDTVSRRKTIWKEPVIKELFRNVIPKKAFDTIIQYTTVTPMIYKNGFLLISGCQPHNCGTGRYVIAVDEAGRKTWAIVAFTDDSFDIKSVECFSTDGNLSVPASIENDFNSAVDGIDITALINNDGNHP
jgi:hypothetical protein